MTRPPVTFEAGPDRPIWIRPRPGERPDLDAVDAVIERAIEDDLAIVFAGRVGGTPYMKRTPYWNHRGTLVDMWSCISFTFRKMPQRTLLSHPSIIEPNREPYKDDYNVRNFTTEWVWNEVRKSRFVFLQPVHESPFRSGMLRWADG